MHCHIPVLIPNFWPDYELVDSGGFEKLERFGRIIIRRPEPQALWTPTLPAKEWATRAQAWFQKTKGNSDAGQWILNADQPSKWFDSFPIPGTDLKLSYKVSLSAFKHVGVFPEQATNWIYIFEKISELRRITHEAPRTLNLFAYTGLASLMARAAGSDVTHLDSIKHTVSWARENMEASKLNGIRWLVDDALKFVQREVRRGNKYQCLILDPPAYGRGPDGEKWILEENLSTLLECCAEILDPDNHLFILNLYSLGFSALITENLLRQNFPKATLEAGEICLVDSFKKKLPLGTFGRFCSLV